MHWLSVKNDMSLSWVQPSSRLQLFTLFKAQRYFSAVLSSSRHLFPCSAHLSSDLFTQLSQLSYLYSLPHSSTPLSLCSSHQLLVLPVFLLPFHLFAPPHPQASSHHLASFSDDCPGAFNLIWRQRAEYTCGFFLWVPCIIWNINVGIIWLPGWGVEVAGAL